MIKRIWKILTTRIEWCLYCNKEEKICGKCKKSYDTSDEFASDIACGECESKALDALIAITIKKGMNEE